MKNVNFILLVFLYVFSFISFNSNSAKGQSSSNQIVGTFEGISESKGTSLRINSDLTVIFNAIDGTIKGNAMLKKDTEGQSKEEQEKIKQKIKEKLNKEVELTGYLVKIKLEKDGHKKSKYFTLVKDGTSLILWGGGDSFYEKKKR